MAPNLEELVLDCSNDYQIEAELCRRHFRDFVDYFWCDVPGAGTLIPNWHIDVFCDELQQIAERVFAGLPALYDIVCNVSPGTSKPVWEGMRVMMGDGTWKALRDVVVDDLVIGKSGKPCRVSAVHTQGELPSVRLTTMGGRKIITAIDHPILTADGWMEAGKIRPDQMLALMHRPKVMSSSDRSDDEFRLAGYFIGDGSTSQNNCSLTSKDPEYIDDFVACADRMGFDCSIRVDVNGVTRINPIARKGGKREEFRCPVCNSLFTTDRVKVRCCSGKCGAKWNAEYKRGERKWVEKKYSKKRGKTCRDWLRDVGIAGKDSYTKAIPSFVWKGSDEQVSLFLAAYFHCDGHVSYKHDGKRNLTVSMCSVSRKLARGVQRLLLRLGVQMRLRRHVAKQGFAYNRGLTNYVYYTVETTDQDAASRFLERIPLLGRKLEKLKGFRPERRTFEQRYLPDKVVSVEKIGSLPCRCLTVEGDSSFVVDGVVVHNSTIWLILFPAWVWTRMPHARIMTASHTDSLVLDLATKSRDVIRSDHYRACFPEIEMATVQDAKGYYRNTLGGDRFACTVGGKTPMGFHAHFLLGDDLLDPMKALSEAESKNAANFIENYLPSRMVDKQVSVMGLVMQRLGRNDPTEIMLDIGKRDGARPVRHLCLPAELLRNGKDRINPPELAERYVNGLMDPQRLPKTVLNAYRARGEYFYASQFLQEPIALGGGMFREEYFSRRVKAAPFEAKRIRYWDRASSVDSSAAYTAGVLMARDEEGIFYVEHVVHGRWEPFERNQKILATALRDRDRYGPRHTPIIYVENEGGSSGVDAWRSLAKTLAGFVVRKDQPTGSKDTRAEPWSCQLAAGMVKIVEDGTWDIRSFVEEHCLFRPEPGKKLGRYKDQVDASSASFMLLSGNKQAGTLRTYSVGGSDMKKRSQQRIVICTPEELPAIQLDLPSLFLCLRDYGQEAIPSVHGLVKNLENLTLCFADVEPEQHQESFDDPLDAYGKPVSEVMMREEHGRKLWAFLRRQRTTNWNILVIEDDRGVGESIALAICNVSGYDPSIITIASNHEQKAEVLNSHVYNMVKATRSMVL